MSNGTKLYALDATDQKLLTLNTTTGVATAATLFAITAGPASMLYTARVSDGSDTEVASPYRLFRLELLGTESLAMDARPLTTLEALAAAIQSAFVTRIGGVSMSAERGALIVSVPPQDLGGGFADSDESRVLGLSPQAGARTFDGSGGETITEALDRLVRMDGNFYFVTLGEAIIDTGDVLEAAVWAASNDRFLLADSHQAEALDPGDTASVLARLAASGSPSAAGVWSRTSDYKARGTVRGRQLRGYTLADHSQVQAAVRDRAGRAHAEPGGGATRARRQLVLESRRHTNRSGGHIVPRLDRCAGLPRLARDAHPREPVQRAARRESSAADRYRNCGAQGGGRGRLRAGCPQRWHRARYARRDPGERHPARYGNPDFGGVLSNGYLVHVLPVAEQPQADREARKAPPVSVWLKGSGAVHFVDISLVFEN